MVGSLEETGVFVAVLIFSDVPSATIHPIVPYGHWAGLVHIHLYQVPLSVSLPCRHVLIKFQYQFYAGLILFSQPV